MILSTQENCVAISVLYILICAEYVGVLEEKSPDFSEFLRNKNANKYVSEIPLYQYMQANFVSKDN